MSHPAFTIRRTSEADWREVRDLRLEMLRDTPDAYAETLRDALQHDEAEWRMRALRGLAEHGISVVAIADDGRWVGAMAGFVPDSTTGPLLVGVYVAPEVRGRAVGLTDALLATVESWAHTEGATLTLHVHERNHRAQRAYERRGYEATGVTVPYTLDSTANEIEMVKRL